jgi:predicted anti-sigma-YlaC factor YlaD
MRCKKFEKLILRSFDNRLNEKERKELEKHLESCAQCREKREEYEIILSLLREEETVQPKAYFWERLRTKIRERKKRPLWLLVKEWSLRAVPLSLLIVLLITLVVIFFSPSQDQELSQSEVLLLRNLNPLQETQLLLEQRLENQNMMIIFSSMEEQETLRR